MKYIIFLLFLPLTLRSQNTTSYESYFQTITDNESVNIYHVKMVIKVTDDYVEVLSDVESEFMSLAKIEVEWKIGTGFLLSYKGNHNIFYYPKINKLVILNLNNQTESVFYGNIPKSVEISK